MAPPRGQASYKKKDGVLAISKDRKAVSWTVASPPDASPSLVVQASSITHLQQTPESNPKVMLKIFVQETGKTEPVAYTFQFTSSGDARTEANAIKDALTSVIQAQKAALLAAETGSGHSAAMTIANAITGGGRAGNIWEDDEALVKNIELQQSLMREDKLLRDTFLEAKQMKPEEMSSTQFAMQFWSSRIPQLRAHAIAQNQGRGRYNVLAEVKPSQGDKGMTITQEHIRVIFEQYPVMRTVYDEVVPYKIKSEADFWSRFFQSQLYHTLRGLKVDRQRDAKDSVLDKYLDHPELTGARPTSSELHIPKFIDLEGNEENHSQRKGNRPNVELRASALDKAPIIRQLNALSEKLMAGVRPSDVDASAPIGIDEATFEQLRLRDLAGEAEENRITLNIRDQSRFFGENSSEPKADEYHIIDPAEALRSVCDDLASHFGHPGSGTLPVGYESEEEEEDEGTFSSTVSAAAHIMALTKANREQTAPIAATSGLSESIYERLTLTHATSLEFLRQFWSAFLSGDPNRAADIGSLVKSLENALLRIRSIADDAEKERKDIIDRELAIAEQKFRVSGRRQRVNEAAIGGGKEVVGQLLGPLQNSIRAAEAKYKEAYREQSRLLDPRALQH